MSRREPTSGSQIYKLKGYHHGNHIFFPLGAGEDPLIDDQNDHDINSVAGVLKLYFRGLENPLFPKERFLDFISTISESHWTENPPSDHESNKKKNTHLSTSEKLSFAVEQHDTWKRSERQDSEADISQSRRRAWATSVCSVWLLHRITLRTFQTVWSLNPPRPPSGGRRKDGKEIIYSSVSFQSFSSFCCSLKRPELETGPYVSLYNSEFFRDRQSHVIIIIII